MAVKLAVLKSGEDVIADIREMMVGDEDTPPEKKKVVGYYLNLRLVFGSYLPVAVHLALEILRSCPFIF